MTWKEFKVIVKPYTTAVYNKKTANETITFWNGNIISKYELRQRGTKILKQIKMPIKLIEFPDGDVIGLEWPFKSKINYEKRTNN